MKFSILSAGSATILFCATAQAATVFSSQATFLAAVQPGSYLETFTASAPPNYSANGFTYTVSSPGAIYNQGTFIGANTSNNPFTFTFTSGNVTAVGGNFWHSDAGDIFQSGLTISITLSDSTVDTYTPASASEFRGYTSPGVPITSLTISAPSGGTFINVDNVTVGAAIPEPGSALLLAGALGMTLRRRRTA